MSANGEVLWVLAVHLVLTGLPAAAATLFALRSGVRDLPLLLAVALAASGLAAFGAFWAYFAGPTVGEAWDWVVLLGSIQVAVLSLWRGGLDRELLRALRTPLLLWALGCLFIVFLGFLHGGTDNAIGMSSTRFSGQLPSDNDIPRYFAEWFSTQGSNGTPPPYPPDWLMSDRPPLQVGYVLSQRAFTPAAENLHYEVLCVVVQQLWLVALWAVLLAARLRPLTRGLVMAAAFVSDVAILHGFFVWPKLIAAAFLLAAVALLISPAWEEQRRRPWVGALLGSLLALSLLAHGSSIYGVVPLVFVAWRRGLPSWRWVGAAALAGFVLMASWTAYQRYDNPPGDRLVKWHLAGVMEIDERGSLEAILDSYGDAGLDGALDNKWNNVAELSGIDRVDEGLVNAVEQAGDGDWDTALGSVRTYRFFDLLPFLGLFLLAPLAMLLARARGLGRREEEWRFALWCLAIVSIGCLFWVLVQWGTPGHSSTMIHAGTLAIPLLAVAGCAAGLHSVFPRFAAALVAVNSALVLLMYTPSLMPLAGTEYSPVAALLAAAGLAGFLWAAFRAPRLSAAPRG